VYRYQFSAPTGYITFFGDHRGLVRVTLQDDKVTLPNQQYPQWLDLAIKVVERYLQGEKVDLTTIPVDWREIGGTEFQQRVWHGCQQIGYGSLRAYSWLAERIGCPRGYQAVGQALGRNPVPLVIPCHRVIAKNGLGGFTGGLRIKRALLSLEGQDDNCWRG